MRVPGTMTVSLGAPTPTAGVPKTRLRSSGIASLMCRPSDWRSTRASVAAGVVGRSVAACDVDDVGERLTIYIALEVLREDLRDAPEELRGDPRDVRCDDDLRKLVQGVVLGEGLDVEHIEPRAGDPALPQRPNQRRLLDDRSARHVNEDGARLHPPKLALAHAALGFGRERQEGNEVVRGREELVDAVGRKDEIDVRHQLRRALRPDDTHAERGGACGERFPDLSEPQDTEDPAGDVLADAGRPVPPALDLPADV